jgi:hypothetical protein
MSAAQAAAPQGRGGRGQAQIVLAPDDTLAFPAAPAGFDVRRESIPRGTVETVEYQSKSVGMTRKLVVHLPPGYSSATRYPVFYLEQLRELAHDRARLVAEELGKRGVYRERLRVIDGDVVADGAPQVEFTLIS